MTGDYYAGFYCEGDATVIFISTRRVWLKSPKVRCEYRFGMDVTDIQHLTSGVEVKLQPSSENVELAPAEVEMLAADAVVVCAGVGSYQLAELVQERVNVYL